MSEWFADDVFQKENHFVFVWNAMEHAAVLQDSKTNSFVRFQWEDRVYEDEYFEFNIHVEPLTQDVALIITDFTDEEDEADTVELWNKQMDMLHRTLGA